MTLQILVFFVVVSVFPVIQAHECWKHQKKVLVCGIIIPLAILWILGFADTSAYSEYGALILIVCFAPALWSFFLFRGKPSSKGTMRGLGFIGGISMIVLITLIFLALNRYTFIKQSEYRVIVYDRWTGIEKRY